MNASETRHANFMELFRQFRERNATLPDRGMLKLFAEHLGMSDRFLSHIKCNRKAIGHAVARQIEDASGKLEGWLDQPHKDLDPKSLPERDFLETALALYRDDPAGAGSLMTEMLKQRLKVK